MMRIKQIQQACGWVKNSMDYAPFGTVKDFIPELENYFLLLNGLQKTFLNPNSMGSYSLVEGYLIKLAVMLGKRIALMMNGINWLIKFLMHLELLINPFLKDTNLWKRLLTKSKILMLLLQSRHFVKEKIIFKSF